MLDIIVTCDCGARMLKIEDGRLESTRFHVPENYPRTAMEFICPECNRAIDLEWEAAQTLTGLLPMENE